MKVSKNLSIKQPLPPEGQSIEYKLSLTGPEVLARVIASFANTAGGRIIVGIGDDESVLGLTDELIADSPAIVEKALQHLKPRPPIKYQVAETNGKKLFVIDVQTSQFPVLTEYGRFYIRK